MVDTPYDMISKIEEIKQYKKVQAEKQKIKRSEQFQPLTGYASKDEPWRQFYTDEDENITVPKKKMIDHLMDCNKDNLD